MNSDDWSNHEKVTEIPLFGVRTFAKIHSIDR